MKTLGYIIFVVAILFSIQWLADDKMQSIKTSEVGKINRILYTDETFDITFWGSSTTQNHFNDSLIGAMLNLKAYNFGINGTSFNQYQGLLNNYIDRAKPNEKIVLGLDIHGLVKRKALYQPYYYVHTFTNDYMYEALSGIDKHYVWKGKFVPFYKLTQYGKHNFSLIKNEPIKNEFPKYGFKGQNRKWNVSEMNEESTFSLDSAYTNEMVLENLKATITRALSKDCIVIIVLTPLFYDKYKAVKGINKFVEQVNTFEEIENVDVISFLDDEICLNQSYFFNNTHLNEKGANQFSMKFIQHIK